VCTFTGLKNKHTPDERNLSEMSKDNNIRDEREGARQRIGSAARVAQWRGGRWGASHVGETRVERDVADGGEGDQRARGSVRVAIGSDDYQHT